MENYTGGIKGYFRPVENASTLRGRLNRSLDYARKHNPDRKKELGIRPYDLIKLKQNLISPQELNNSKINSSSESKRIKDNILELIGTEQEYSYIVRPIGLNIDDSKESNRLILEYIIPDEFYEQRQIAIEQIPWEKGHEPSPDILPKFIIGKFKPWQSTETKEDIIDFIATGLIEEITFDPVKILIREPIS